MRQFLAHSIPELRKAARHIIEAFPEERVFALQGNLGAGKTMMIKFFCEFLNVTDMVTSPSFGIINEYQSEIGDLIYHFDFYRIKRLEEVMDIGYEEYIFSGSYCFMEWPEKIQELLPQHFVYISIMVQPEDESRLITFDRATALPDI